jgi:hypothetical protein
MIRKTTVILFTFCTLLGYGKPSNRDSLRYEILLTGKILNNVHLAENLIPSIDFTSNRLVLLSTTDRFYLLGWGGMQAIGQKVTGPVSSFAYTPDGYLMVIRNRELCRLDSLGNLTRLFGLPNPSMGICSGRNVMYVYDQRKGQVRNAIYVLAKGGKYAPLLEVPTAINSVIEAGSVLLFSTENAIYSFNPRSKKLKALLVVNKDKEIKSIAIDTAINRIFFSTGNAIYAVKDSGMVTLNKDFGGVLRYFNNGLLVFNPEKKILIRMVGIEDMIASEIQTRKNAATGRNPVSKEAGTAQKTETAAEKPAIAKEEPPLKPREEAKETPVQPRPVTANETQSKPEEEPVIPPSKEMRSQARFIAERFISNAEGPVEKGKTYILKKDFSRPVDLLNAFPDGSILKLVGSDPATVKSWKAIKPSDGTKALIGSKLYMYFDQAQVWLLQQSH